MCKTVISLQNVAKRYRLFASQKDRLKEALHPFRRRFHQEFWALRDINLTIDRGETVGILGRNGAGKSTLLSIISGVLEPSAGSRVIRAVRVSSLLGLGVGFDPELTGRKNVEFFCTYVGLTSKQIKKLMPEIEAFANIGNFIDQPLRSYSSGMFVRLAFSAAVAIEPDMLVIDEVLAVGDARFQQKCFAKFADFQNQGKTIVLATHNVELVTQFCTRALILDRGMIVEDDTPDTVLTSYFRILFGDSSSMAVGSDAASHRSSFNVAPSVNAIIDELLHSPHQGLEARPFYNPEERRYGDGRAEIVDVVLVVDGRSTESPCFNTGTRLELYMLVRFHKNLENPSYGFIVKSTQGLLLYSASTDTRGIVMDTAGPNEEVLVRITCILPLKGGDYFFDLGVSTTDQQQIVVIDARHSVLHIKVEKTSHFDGVVDLDSRLEEVDRRRIGVEHLSPQGSAPHRLNDEPIQESHSSGD